MHFLIRHVFIHVYVVLRAGVGRKTGWACNRCALVFCRERWNGRYVSRQGCWNALWRSVRTAEQANCCCKIGRVLLRVALRDAGISSTRAVARGAPLAVVASEARNAGCAVGEGRLIRSRIRTAGVGVALGVGIAIGVLALRRRRCFRRAWVIVAKVGRTGSRRRG